MARPALARHDRHRAGHARDRVPAARPAADHRAQPRHHPAQPRARLHARHGGGSSYQQRKFFDWGGWLAVRPMDELPHWRVVMRRERGPARASAGIAEEHAEAIVEMRALLRERGTRQQPRLRDGRRAPRTQSYRGRKDSALALYYLWRTGEVMITPRALRARLRADRNGRAGASTSRKRPEAEADRFLIKRTSASPGFAQLCRRATGTSCATSRTPRSQTWRDAQLADGELIEVEVEGWKATHVRARQRGADRSRPSRAGRVPRGWTPLETTTTEEVVVPRAARSRSARAAGATVAVWLRLRVGGLQACGQAQVRLLRLPILWGDRLVGRTDMRLDRATSTLVVNGLWFEDPATERDERFRSALAAGMDRFLGFVGASALSAPGIALLR